MTLTRRAFISQVSAAGAIALPAIAYGRILGSNEQMRVAVIGVKGRGNEHIAGFRDQLVALCDCDRHWLGIRAAEFKQQTGSDVKQVVDYRQIMDDHKIDAVSIATPNHTHALIAIAAAESGKDVYVEKPVSHNVWEGRQIVHAAQKYNRVIQCGTQSRSSTGLREAVQFVREGKLGKVRYAIGTCYKPRKSIGRLSTPLKIPETVDYDLWCGPAEKRELYRPRLHYDWHWDFNTGNGDMGNQGIHQMDLARWFLGYQHVSPTVLSVGGRLGYEDAGDTPNTQTVLHGYPEAPIIFETRGLPRAKEYQDDRWEKNMDVYRGATIGVIVQCENGYVLIPNYHAATAFDEGGNQVQAWSGSGDHFENFRQAVAARNTSLLNADILQGHLSSALCHTGAVSHQVGRPATVSEVRGEVSGDGPFADSVQRMIAHLEKNGIDTDQPVLTLGARLVVDPESETVPGHAEANQRMTRRYRKPFEVPDLA